MRGFVNIDSLAIAAAQLQEILRANRRENMTDDNENLIQALCVAEEGGEVAGAYRRYAGLARRTGTKQQVEEEIADVLIVTAVLAYLLEIDISQAVTDKLGIIYSRGWKEGE